MYVANDDSTANALDFSVDNAEESTTAVELVFDNPDDNITDSPDTDALVLDNAEDKTTALEFVIEMETLTFTT